MRRINALIAIILCTLTFTVYTFTQVKGGTAQNHFIRLADSMIKGHVYLVDPPTYLELTGHDEDHIRYVVYPPMPAIVAIPFVYFNIFEKSQTFISILFASLNAGLMYLVFRRLFLSRRIALTITIAYAFGTNIWYLASEGSSWYIAHVLGVFFTLVAMFLLDIRSLENTITTTKNTFIWLLAGLCVGAAYWSRLPAVLVVPFFILVWIGKNKTALDIDFRSVFSSKNYLKILNKDKKQIILFGAGIATFIGFNFLYNYLRFGTINDVAYTMIPGVLQEGWYSDGIFSINYLRRNLEIFFFQMPQRYDTFPYFKPSLYAMSFFITSPFFILLPLMRWKNYLAVSAFLTGILMLMPGLLHGTPGFSQFGYRFAAEATPLFLISFASFLQRKYWWVSVPFIILAIAVNFWGIYFIRTLGIIGW